VLDFVQGGVSKLRSIGLIVIAAFTAFTLTVVLSDNAGVSATDWVFALTSVAGAAVVWFLAIDRTLRRPAGNSQAAVGLACGILGVLAIPLIFSAFSGLFGAGALMLGMEAKRRAALGQGRPRMAQWAVVLGGIELGMFGVIWLTIALTV